MSKLWNLLGNGMSGSIFNVTYSTSKGQTTVRMKMAPKSRKRFTRRQARRIARWANIVCFWRLFCNKLKPSFESVDTLKSMFNQFVALNANISPVYLTKNEAIQGSCVVAPYQVSSGTINSITLSLEGQVIRTDIRLGSGFSIDSNTTVSQFSEVLLSNNSDFKNDDKITFYLIEQTIDQVTNMPRVRITPEQIQLSTSNTTTLLRSLVSSAGFSVVNGYLGMGSAVTGGAVYIHTRRNGQTTLASSQRVMVTHNLLAAYGTNERMLASAASYGEVREDDYLTPENEDEADIVDVNSNGNGLNP